MSLVWENETWWREHIASRPSWWRVERSEEEPSKIRYFRMEHHARDGRWTRVKPGRYLTQWCFITPKQVKYWAEYQARGERPSDDAPAIEVKFASTPDEIEHVYLNGPRSCMSHKAETYESSCHPVRIYGAGDLAIAYLENTEDGIYARALCWPERKVFGRVYPTENDDLQDELRDALHALGYQHVRSGVGTMAGARMLRIEEDDGVVMPYLDAPYHWFTDDGEYLYLSSCASDIDGTSTTGQAQLNTGVLCDRCEDRVQETYTVYREVRRYGGGYAEEWCEYCHNNHAFHCRGFHETFAEEVPHDEWNDEIYTDLWLEENTFISDWSGDRVAVSDMEELDNGDTWSRTEFAEHGFTCRITGRRFSQDEMHPDMQDVWGNAVMPEGMNAPPDTRTIVDERQVEFELWSF